MKIVIFRALCAGIILAVIVTIYIILQHFGDKGIKIFRSSIVRWVLSFVSGISLFLMTANLIFA